MTGAVLSLIFLDSDGQLRALRSEDGASFVEATPPEGVSTSLPIAHHILPDGRVFAAFVAEGGEVMAGVSDDGVSFDWHEVPGARTSHPPAVAYWRDTFCLAVTGDDERLYLARAEDVPDLALAPAHDGARSRRGPTLAATRARLFMGICGNDGAPYVGTSDDGVTIRVSRLALAAKTSVPVAAAAWGNTVYLVARGDDEVPYLACSDDGPDFSFRPLGAGALTQATPALAVVDGRLCCVLTGTDDALWAGSIDGGDIGFSPIDGAPQTSLAVSLSSSRAGEPEAEARSRVTGVFFVPRRVPFDEARAAASAERLNAHLELAQQRYQDWLGSDTFALDRGARVVHGAHLLKHYEKGDAWSKIAPEVLAAFGENKFTSTRVYVILFVRPDDFDYDGQWSCMGCAGELDAEGAGAVLMEYKSLFDDFPFPFQSTIVHELGHGFGLPHSDHWGEDMNTGRSIMSYNPRHRTAGFDLADPGELLPQELEQLSRNELVFPDFDGG